MVWVATELGVPRPAFFKSGGLQLLRGSALLCSFALFYALFAFVCVLPSFAPFCALLRSFVHPTAFRAAAFGNFRQKGSETGIRRSGCPSTRDGQQHALNQVRGWVQGFGLFRFCEHKAENKMDAPQALFLVGISEPKKIFSPPPSPIPRSHPPQSRKKIKNIRNVRQLLKDSTRKRLQMKSADFFLLSLWECKG